MNLRKNLDTTDTQEIDNSDEWTEENLKTQLDEWMQQIDELAEVSCKM